MQLTVNGTIRDVPAEWQQDTLLFVLREALDLCGPKFGCGVGLCGACTVLLDGEAQRSCLVSASDAVGRTITTVEGLAAGDRLHAVQQAWLDERVAQCGYCQAGQVVGAVALLRASPDPSEAEITAAMAGHLCRCGTQQRIRRAIRRAATATNKS